MIVFLYPLLIQIGLHQLGLLLLQNFHHIHQQPSEADVINDRFLLEVGDLDYNEKRIGNINHAKIQPIKLFTFI